jgi:hypothetical protein
MKEWDRKALPWIVGGFVVLVAVSSWKREASEPAKTAPTPSASEPPPSPVSEECTKLSELAERSGAVSPASVDSKGMVMHVTSAWTQMPFDSQKKLAECLSHYVAGGQDRWVKRIVFRNQASGITYGTIENSRYRAGE